VTRRKVDVGIGIGQAEQIVGCPITVTCGMRPSSHASRLVPVATILPIPPFAFPSLFVNPGFEAFHPTWLLTCTRSPPGARLRPWSVWSEACSPNSETILVPGGGKMQIASLCGGSVVVARRDSSVREAAELMRRYHVGAVVAIDVANSIQVPVGIVTDRDIVVEVIAMKLDPADLTVGDIMSAELVSIPEDCDVYDAIRTMREKGVHRVPVVNAQGALTGLVSLDDVLPIVAQELAELAKLPLASRKQECELRH
jgi:CBS domain-containing protein